MKIRVEKGRLLETQSRRFRKNREQRKESIREIAQKFPELTGVYLHWKGPPDTQHPE